MKYTWVNRLHLASIVTIAPFLVQPSHASYQLASDQALFEPAHFDQAPYNHKPSDPESSYSFSNFTNPHVQAFDGYSFTATADTNISTIELPELSYGGRFIEQNRHKAIGEWSLRQLNANARLLDDPWTQATLESLVWQINAQARQQAPLALVVVNNPSINAFAIPGGVMGINTGTVLTANSIDEVASVVAHEAAHLSQRHYEHREAANNKALLLQIGGMLAALAASMADGDAAAAIMMGSQTVALDSQMAFSRSNEREADRIGMQLMAKAGYDPRAMPRFFSVLNAKSQLNMSKQAFLPSFIMTHPLSSERLSEAQSRANRYASSHLSQTSMPSRQTDFDLLKWRTKVLTKQTNEAELVSAARSNTGAQLALAYWYADQGRYQESTNILNNLKQKLHAKKPSSSATTQMTVEASEQQTLELLLALTEAHVAGKQGRWQEAETLITSYHRLYPERQDLKLYLADIQLQLNKSTAALSIIKSISKSRPHDIAVLSRIQHAYEAIAVNHSKTDTKLANIATINALRYRAKTQLWTGNYSSALVSLNQARVLTEKSLTADSKGMKTAANTNYNLRPLLANIKNEREQVKMAKAFTP